MSTMRVRIKAGRMQFIYDDRLAGLIKPGDRVTRASHVEPHPTRPGWVADMRPSEGPVLGHDSEFWPQSDLPLDYVGDLERRIMASVLAPFATRQDALNAERDWLRKEKGL